MSEHSGFLKRILQVLRQKPAQQTGGYEVRTGTPAALRPQEQQTTRLRQVQHSEEGLRITLQSMGDGVIATDSRAIVTMLNPSAEELTGWPQHKAVGQPFRDVFQIYNSVTGEPSEDIVNRVLTTGRKVNLANHTVLVSADGTHRHISDSAAPIRDADGTLLGVVLIFSDVTERYHLQQQLRIQEARSSMAVRLANLGTWEYDNRTDTILWSELYKKILGIDPKVDPEPGFWSSMMHPDDLDAALSARDQALQSGGVTYAQSYRIYRHSDGALRYLHTHVSIERDELGRAVKTVGAVQDITEQVEAQRQIAESELLFRMTFERMAMGMAHVALDGRLLRVNPALCHMLGYTEEELLQRTTQDVVHPADHALVERTMGWMLETRSTTEAAERRFVRKDGAVVWLALSSSIMPDAQGEPAYLITSLQDVTARRMGEMALRQSEQRLRRAQEISHTGNWEITLATQQMWASDEAFHIYGYEMTEGNILPLSVPQGAVVEQDRPGMDRALQRLIAEDAPYDMEFSIRRLGDGELRVLHSRAVLERDEQRRPVRIVGVLQDITEGRRTEEEYGQALATTLDGFWVVDGSTHIIEVNQSICHMLGYTRDELIGKHILDIQVQAYPDEAAKIRERVYANGSERFDARLRRKNGVVIDVEVSLSLVRNAQRTCAFMRDITDRKRKEEHIQYLSYHDVLTGLYNRAFFEEESKRLDNARQLPLTVIMGDINGLKLTNDVFGHARGDELLTSIAGILRRCARAEDIVARIGGDEFCILLPRAGEQIARIICDRIQSACRHSVINLDDNQVHPSVSLGHATRITLRQSFGSVFKDAEDAMYKRKLLERKSMHSSLIASIRTTMYEKSHETHEHAERLAALARRLGVAVGLNDDQLSELELLSALHDLGKIGVPEHILDKAGALTDEEWTQMRKHPEIGYRIAQASPELAAVAEGILNHHERWDGKGYPQGLSGEAIPLLARILTIVDSYDAMTNDRVYHPAIPQEAALAEIARCAGSQYDPAIARRFLELMQAPKDAQDGPDLT